MGELVVVEQDGVVVASRGATEEELRDSLAPTEPADKPSQPVESPSEPEPEPEPEPQEAADDRDDKGRFKKGAVEKKGESIQARIDRLRYEQGEEERRLDRLRQERQQLETAKPEPVTAKPPVVTPAGVQTFKQFVTTYAADHPDATYEDAIDAYQEIRDAALFSKFTAKTHADREQQELQSLVTAHQQRESILKAITPDWDTNANAAGQVLAAAGFPQLPLVLDRAILRSDQSEHIVRDLITHHEFLIQVARQASGLPLTPAAVELMRDRLESRLSNGSSPAPRSGPGEAPRQSQAKAPPKPVGSSPSASDASDEPSYEQLQERLYPKRR